MCPKYTTDDATRFWSKVHKTSDCWLWVGDQFSNGYGRFTVSKGPQVGAHRTAYELAYGPIPRGMVICHRCDTKLCVRPDHLFAGTQADNMHDMIAKGRDRKAEYDKQVRGEHHPVAKLTDDDVRSIRRLSADGVSQVQLARQFGVARSLIHRILYRLSWSHID